MSDPVFKTMVFSLALFRLNYGNATLAGISAAGLENTVFKNVGFFRFAGVSAAGLENTVFKNLGFFRFFQSLKILKIPKLGF